MLPGTRHATARHSAPVSGTARCGWPTEIIRTRMSVSSGASRGPRACATRRARRPSRPWGRPGSRRPRRRRRNSHRDGCGAADRLERVEQGRVPLQRVRQLGRGAGRDRRRARTRTGWRRRSCCASIRPSPATSSMSVARPLGSSRPVRAPAGSAKSSRIGAPVPATPSSARSPATAACSPSMPEPRDDDLARVGVVDAHGRIAGRSDGGPGPRRPRTARPPRTCCRNCRSNRRARDLDRDLREGVVHVGIVAARRADDADFRQRGDAAAHAVELPPVGVGRAHDGEEDRRPGVAVGGQIACAEHHRL